MNPTSLPNQSLKHTNPQFYIRKTEVRSRAIVPVEPYWAPKIHPVGLFLSQFSVPKQAFPAT